MEESLEMNGTARDAAFFGVTLRANAKRFVLAHKAELVCACLLLVMGANMLLVISRKSITNDEVVSIPAGYYHLVVRNFQISMQHPPLTKMWAALPMLFIQPNEVPITVRPGEDSLERTLRAQEEFWNANGEHFAAISFWTRVPMIAITLALGVLIFIYARQLFGARAAMLAVFLFSLEPNILAHGRTVLNDVPAAAAYLLFCFALHAYLKSPDWRHAFGLGAVSGLAVVTKFSMIVVAPVLAFVLIAAILFAPRRGQRRLYVMGRGSVVALTALLVINAVYYFKGEPVGNLEFPWLASMFSPARLDTVMLAVRATAKIVPSYMLAGIDWTLAKNKYGNPASLMGAYSDTGWWYYFPTAFALKTTIPFLLTSVAALLWALWRLLQKRERVFLALLVPLGVYLLISLTSHINMGIRHFLPAFPFLFILGGAFLDWLLRQRRLGHAALAIVVVLAGWTVVEAVRAYPNHMSYMNELTWSHPRWYYLSDSNVEWGDDVPELANYLRARGETKVRAALLGGWLTLPRYGVAYVSLLAPPGTQLPETRYIAIGASFLNGSTVPFNRPGQKREDYFAEYRNRVPEAVFGNSIYLYREK
jgi:4-amino-4-deoxy-L-arabinose transferase-like glycosyltransferase